MNKTERFFLPFRWQVSLLIISVCALSLVAAMASFYSIERFRFNNEIYRRLKPPTAC
jgi:hypothetical protein